MEKFPLITYIIYGKVKNTRRRMQLTATESRFLIILPWIMMIHTFSRRQKSFAWSFRAFALIMGSLLFFSSLHVVNNYQEFKAKRSSANWKQEKTELESLSKRKLRRKILSKLVNASSSLLDIPRLAQPTHFSDI